MKSLQVSDYAKYLIHNLQVQFEDKKHFLNFIIGGKNFGFHDGRQGSGSTNDISKIKPYLRPISQMSQQIEYNGKKLIPIVELARLAECDTLFSYKCEITEGASFMCAINHSEFRDFVFYENCFCFFKKGGGHSICPNQDKLFEALYSWHFWLGEQSLFESGQILELK